MVPVVMACRCRAARRRSRTPATPQAAHHRHLGAAERGQHADVGRAQQPAGAKRDRPPRQVFAGQAPVFALANDAGGEDDARAVEAHELLRHDRVQSRWHGGPGHDAHALAQRHGRGDAAAGVNNQARFYLYEMLFEDENGRFRRTHGVIGGLGLPPRAPPGAGDVLPHERTMKRRRPTGSRCSGDARQPRSDLGALARRRDSPP